jgi:hypothetical protein
MKPLLSCSALLLLALAHVPAQAAEALALYDDFKAKLIDPEKWFGSESTGAGTEATRTILFGRLRQGYRAYGETTSDSGIHFSSFRLNFVNQEAV